MIKYNKAFLEYKADKYGTERVLLNNETSVESCAPTLDINYPNTQQTDQQFIYRPTGGSDNIESGLAVVKGIRGNSVAVNQLVINGNFVNTSSWTLTRATLSVNNNEATITLNSNPTSNYSSYISQQIKYVSGHKYYIHIGVKCQHEGTFTIDSNGAFGNITINIPTADVWSEHSFIKTSTINTAPALSLYPKEVDNGYVSGDKYYLRNLMFIDLTLMFGAGNEPSTVEEFEQWLETNIGKKDYYPYTDSKIVNVISSTIETTGFNLWDEQWEVGGYGSSTGQKISSSNQIRCKNLIPILPNTTYYKKCPSPGIYWNIYYDANGNYIKYVAAPYNSSFTTPSNAHYLSFYTEVGYGNTYNNDICINISDTSKNGTYESYNNNTLNLDITRFYGKKNGTGNLVLIWPTGMPGIGNLKDSLTIEDGMAPSAVKRIGSVDLGTLSYTLAYPDTYHTFQVNNMQRYVDNFPNNRANGIGAVCSKFYNAAWVHIAYYGTNGCDDVFCLSDSAIGANALVIRDTSYSDASTFKSAMNGVMLYYELATPETYTELAYDNSQAGDGSELVPFGTLQKRYIGNNPVGRVYIGNNLVWLSLQAL